MSDDVETRRRLPFSRRLVFALLPGLLLLLAAEGVARLVCRHRFGPYETTVRVQGDSRWIADDALIWTNRPYYLEYDQTAQYNEHGIRVEAGDVSLPPKGDHELRILCLGGSAMAGVGSSQQGDWLKITGIGTHPITQSIDGKLQAILSRALPGTRVRVLNAAVASHTIAQSQQRYQALRFLEPDWVISLDGVNEPSALAEAETVWQRLEARWRRHPVNRFPFRPARLLMRSSAMVFLLGEHVFFRTGIIRTARDAGQDVEVMERWLRSVPALSTSPTSTSPTSADRDRAVAAFVRTLAGFHQALAEDGQKHLLLVQPHLSLRDRDQLRDTERALYHYFMNLHGGRIDGFMKSIHAHVATEFRAVPEIASLAALHDADEWVFLDYCHLTKRANELVAARAARFILESMDQSGAG